MHRRHFLSLCASAPLSAARRGPTAFPAWTDDDIDRILADSPWAAWLTVPIEKPPTRTEVYLVVRWKSALPVRQALALAEFGHKQLDDSRAVELLNRKPANLELQIAGFPALLFTGRAPDLESQLRRTARVSVPGQPPAPPESVAVPPHGNHLMAELTFPRFASLTPADQSIRLSATVDGARIEREFKLKEMLYQGRLEV
ncbi:MAG TPA: hypothetical protein PLF84_04550 [Bryobacteraceae bacterium]|nr:hypothetical protein [Bryobacterales bacterium]HRJ18285.1 hypothetical protein [Bryobacteraceae bacterium]